MTTTRRRLMQAIRPLLLLMLWQSLPAAAEPSPPQTRPLVVATIKPLALIAGDLLGDGAEVRQLLPENASPHAYALRVSERRLLARADLILWVGPGLESFLADSLRDQPAERVLTAANLADIHWPPRDRHDPGEQLHDQHIHEQRDHEQHVHEQHGDDVHLWLDPRNATAIAQGIVAALGARGHAIPAESTAAFAARMTRLEANIRTSLAALDTRTFAADHEAFGHFAARFELTPAGHLRDAADHAAGARSVAALTARQDIRCLIAEPDSQLQRMRHLAERLGARVQVVDALGTGTAAGDGGYARLLGAVAEGFARCLGAPPAP